MIRHIPANHTSLHETYRYPPESNKSKNYANWLIDYE